MRRPGSAASPGDSAASASGGVTPAATSRSRSQVSAAACPARGASGTTSAPAALKGATPSRTSMARRA